MGKERITIGALARRSGVSVKTLRFYSDEGLLPPPERSASGYRLYGEDDQIRLDLIRTLRDAGLSLESIRAVLSRRLSLKDALRLRLCALEATIAAEQRVAAAIRVALRSEPSEADLRRLYAVTRLSNEERRKVVERFFDQVSEGTSIDKGWAREMSRIVAPELPDSPTPEQLDAWVELSEILTDPGFVANMREQARDVWGERFDPGAHKMATDEALAAAAAAKARGVAPGSPDADAIAEAMVRRLAEVLRRDFDDEFRAFLLSKYERHDPRSTRYWELVAILNAWPKGESKVDVWQWLADAATAFLRKGRPGRG